MFVWVCSVVLDFRICQYFGFLGLSYFSSVLILYLLLLTVLTPDFGLYLKDVKVLKLCCCKSFFGCSFIECYNVLCLFVILFFKLLFWDRFSLISYCFSFFILSCHNMPPSISLTRYICYVASDLYTNYRQCPGQNCLWLAHAWFLVPLGQALPVYILAINICVSCISFFKNNSVLLQVCLYDSSKMVLLLKGLNWYCLLIKYF